MGGGSIGREQRWEGEVALGGGGCVGRARVVQDGWGCVGREGVVQGRSVRALGLGVHAWVGGCSRVGWRWVYVGGWRGAGRGWV